MNHLKLRKTEPENFFEPFSDLIFATMAIFALLMLIFLTQIKKSVATVTDGKKAAAEVAELKKQLGESKKEKEGLEKKVEEQASKAEKQEKTISEQEKTIDEMGEKVEELEEEVISTSSLELVIAVDASATMADVLEDLSKAILRIGDSIPNVASSFRLGVIVYRKGLRTFPIQEIHPADEDGGKSIESLKDFVRSECVADNSLANIQGAIHQGAEMLASSSNRKSRKSLVLMGDVGPYEMDGDPRSRTNREIRLEKLACDEIAKLATAQSNLSFFAVYTGSKLTDPIDPRNVSDIHRQSTINFFQDLAKAATDDKGKYVDDANDVLSLLLLAIIAAN